MDALKQIPQAFFEFFARFLPGVVGYYLWIAVLGGRPAWDALEPALGVEKRSGDGVDVLRVIVVVAACYIIGQLAAPFGKAMQRLGENIASVVRRTPWLAGAALALSRAPYWVTDADWAEIQRDAEKAAQKARDTDPKPSSDPGDYDWLRAHRPEAGALAAKIRAEHTMFHALAAIFLGALAYHGVVQRGFAAPTDAVLLGLGLACFYRGHSVSVTFKDTSRKLRAAFRDPPPAPAAPRA